MGRPKKQPSKVTALTALTQKDIPSLLDKVNMQIEAIKKGIPEANRITVELPQVGMIKDLETVDELIKAASMVIAKEEAYNKAVKAIVPSTIKVPRFRLNGVTAADWLGEISSRLSYVANKEQLEKLKKIKQKLEENLSAEEKLARDLAEIQNILDGKDED